MKLLLDQNLPPATCRSLAPHFAAVHVRHVGLAAASDELVWQHARDHGFAADSHFDPMS